MMTSIVSAVLILLLFAVSSTAWRTSSGGTFAAVPRFHHHQQWQQNNQLQQLNRSPQQYSTTGTTRTKSAGVLLLATSSVPVYDDFISREDWQALSQEDRNRINEKRRLANPDSDADSSAAPPPTATTVKTTTTTTTTATTVVVADIATDDASSDSSSSNKDDNDGRRYQGVVKWFNMRKGFGFVIREDNKEDIFVHQTSIQAEGFRGLSVGATVEFGIETRGERTAAVAVTKPGGAKLKEVTKTPVVTAVTVVETETTMAAATPPSVSPSEQAVRDLINASMF